MSPQQTPPNQYFQPFALGLPSCRLGSAIALALGAAFPFFTLPMHLNAIATATPLTTIPSTAIPSTAIPLAAQPSTAIAQTPARDGINRPIFSPPTPPQGQSRPKGTRRGGATRAQCLNTKIGPISALIPGTNPANAVNPSQSSSNSPTIPDPPRPWAWGQTTQERPTFWFRTPYALTTQVPGRFRLKHANRTVYEAWIRTEPNASGIFGVQLPSTVPALTPGTPYQWSFSVFCEEQSIGFVNGGVVRVELPQTVSQQIAKTIGRDRLLLLGRQGLWYDTIAHLVQSRFGQPDASKPMLSGQGMHSSQDFRLEGRPNPQGTPDKQVLRDWRQLLQDIDMEDLADEKLIPIQQTPKQ